MGWALALHGGAGDVPRTLPPELREPRLATLRRCLDLGAAALRDGRTALDVVELVVRPSSPSPTPRSRSPACPPAVPRERARSCPARPPTPTDRLTVGGVACRCGSWRTARTSTPAGAPCSPPPAPSRWRRASWRAPCAAAPSRASPPSPTPSRSPGSSWRGRRTSTSPSTAPRPSPGTRYAERACVVRARQS